MQWADHLVLHICDKRSCQASHSKSTNMIMSYPENLEVKVKLSEVSEVNIGIFNILILRFFNITWGEYWSDVLDFLHELLGGVADLPWTDFKEKFTRKQKANT